MVIDITISVFLSFCSSSKTFYLFTGNKQTNNTNNIFIGILKKRETKQKFNINDT